LQPRKQTFHPRKTKALFQFSLLSDDYGALGGPLRELFRDAVVTEIIYFFGSGCAEGGSNPFKRRYIAAIP
jgi:hypothetical protein